ncbi:protein-cysteine N-palmitoyltransferase Rasp [Microplitis demolitor]|uniref:protein-cysteine N-palmitoyltransferase Rasp n=1 Tax=Microplitis demolitor TaxID=69319 RepID=UPI0004CCEE94|nr:protein-cysteine N-palmitoyltransferase Rasp [Microplitis demolitor]XP_053596815.1 protein-cysteine N-palmitoyltransferase Rasp [Microplitis demolitor]
MTGLSRSEVRFYFAAWTCGVLYSLYHVYLSGTYFNKIRNYEDFAIGWSWLGRKQDISDGEWWSFIPLLKKIMPWVAVQLLISHIIKYKKLSSTVSCCWYILVSLGFLWTYIGTSGTIFMMIQPCIVCLLISIRNLPLIYFVELGLLYVYQYDPLMNLVWNNWLQVDNEWEYILTVTIFWVQLRSISCAVDNITGYRHRNLGGFFRNFIETTAYCLYLPTLCTGPFFLYSDFRKGIYGPNDTWTLRRVGNTCFNLLRFIFWLLFTELAMHFVYTSAFKSYPREVGSFNSWAFYGFGYSMGQYFCNKYIVVYGLAGEMSRADDINAPPPPKCIGRVHLYSEMWKHFDRGLYYFLVKYIYGPIAKFNFPLKKFFASLLTFSFIYFWHGLSKYVFVWSLLNFIGITVESITRYIGNTWFYSYYINKYMSPENARRFHCLIATPLLSMSAVSNFYFFSGMTIGNLFALRLFQDSWITIFTRTFFLYCCCQVSTEVKILENLNKNKKKLIP